MPLTTAAIAATHIAAGQLAAGPAAPCQHHCDHAQSLIKPLCLLAPPVPFEADALAPITPEEMADRIAARGEPDLIVRSANRGGLTVQFNVFGTTNADTTSALQFTADYYAATVLDNITVELDVEFDPGSFGGASPSIISISYAEYLAALRADADADDTIQNDLPEGSFPARRIPDGAVSQEDTLTLTTANAKALGILPSGSGVDASLFIGSLPDGDPSDGIGNGLSGEFLGDFSLVDILVHEVGHSLGFINVIEFGLPNATSLDAYRFQRTGPENPSDASEFAAFPRALWTEFNASTDQLHTFDFIEREHLASNASDFQASHFEETGAFPNRIGVMEPAIAPFETGFPDYFSQADIDAFDAIGWDIVASASPCNPADIAEPFAVLDLADVVAFVSAFTNTEPAADLAAPFGVFDLSDVVAFVTAFNDGCP
jgi:hypothetical protein